MYKHLMPKKKVGLIVRNTIEWSRAAWEELSLNTVKNCWNHAKNPPQPVTSGPVDAAIDELKDLLVEFLGSGIDVNNLVNHVSEQLTRQLCMMLARHQTKWRLMKASHWSQLLCAMPQQRGRQSRFF
jgi:hypothetical protein